MTETFRKALSRRHFLSSAAFLIAATSSSKVLARSISGTLPWAPFAAEPPPQVQPSGWYFFTPDEARLVEAIVDRLIPADDLSIGGKEAGCAVYIDRQMISAYGKSSHLYTQGPFLPGLPTQGYQAAANPSQRYRTGLAAIDAYVSTSQSGKKFADLSAQEQDTVLKGMESGEITLADDVNGKQFFALILQNTMEGFFADPIYGGNKGMVSWHLLGFPGARYDYRDHVSKHNQTYPLPPVSIAGSPDWSLK